jgi:L-ascorbate metabolism protein UlaG (beta-lactamase superfamily)
MGALGDIDVALLPVGGTYTMDAAEAAKAIERIKPTQAIPYHWGDIVGGRADAEQFAVSASCEVTVLSPGESVDLGE